ncbi:MAG: hypothetical protein MHMPM18_004486, partial [Marteilia pararefringens]
NPTVKDQVQQDSPSYFLSSTDCFPGHKLQQITEKLKHRGKTCDGDSLLSRQIVNSFPSDLHLAVLEFISISSTMDISKLCAELVDKPELLIVIIARDQYKGRGRRLGSGIDSNRWQSSSEGSIALTIVMCLNISKINCTNLTLFQAIFVDRALKRSNNGISTIVKYPNDLLLDGSFKKIGGILVESAAYFQRPIVFSCGIGINLINIGNYSGVFETSQFRDISNLNKLKCDIMADIVHQNIDFFKLLDQKATLIDEHIELYLAISSMKSMKITIDTKLIELISQNSGRTMRTKNNGEFLNAIIQNINRDGQIVIKLDEYHSDTQNCEKILIDPAWSSFDFSQRRFYLK